MILYEALWWGISAIAALTGLVVSARALFGDKSRGRRRCPKCWYDLSRSPTLKCAECGHEPQRESKTRLTRRHWRMATLGIILLIGSGGGLIGREMYRSGSWVKATPTVGYIAFLPHLDRGPRDELHRRLKEGELRGWEYRLLISRCMTALRSDDEERLVAAIRILQDIEGFELSRARSREQRMPWGNWIKVSEVDPHGGIDALVPLFQHKSSHVRRAAVELVGHLGDAGRRALPAVIGLMADDNAFVVEAARRACTHIMWGSGDLSFVGERGCYHLFFPPALCRRIAACGIDNPHLLPVLIEVMQTDPRGHGARTALVLGMALFQDDPRWQQLVIDHASDPSARMHYWAVRYTSRFPFDERVRNILRESLSRVDPEDFRTQGAVPSIAYRGAEAAEFLPQIEEFLHRGQYSSMRIDVTRCFLAIGGDIDVIIGLLDQWLPPDPQEPELPRRIAPWGSYEVLTALSARSAFSPNALPVLERYMTQIDESWIRAAAAHCYAALGGDRATATRVVLTGGNVSTAGDMFRANLLDWQTLAEALKFGEEEERLTAARLLGDLGADAVTQLPALRPLLFDPSRRLAAEAEEAVQIIEFHARRQRNGAGER